MIVKSPNKAVPRAAAPPLAVELGPLAETCRSLLAQLRMACGSPAAPQTIGVAASNPREGTTSVAANLAVAAARSGGLRVALIEAAVDRPVVARAFGLPRAPGFFDVLWERAELDDALLQIAGLDLWVAAAGQNSSGILAGPQLNVLADVANELKKRCDLIVFDLPNASRPACLLPLASQMDGVVLVVEAERTSWDAALRTKEMLLQARGRVLGCVLNKRRDRIPAWLDRAL